MIPKVIHNGRRSTYFPTAFDVSLNGVRRIPERRSTYSSGVRRILTAFDVRGTAFDVQKQRRSTNFFNGVRRIFEVPQPSQLTVLKGNPKNWGVPSFNKELIYKNKKDRETCSGQHADAAFGVVCLRQPC